jgi:ABC-type uncharacterized transport system permease subunit
VPRAVWLALAAIALAFLATAFLVALAGKNPLTAFAAVLAGAFGSWQRIGVALNKTTPFLLCGVGVALCFRARIINIGGEGQIAVGGLAGAWVALNIGALTLPLALLAGAAAGALWAGLAALVSLKRRVHEVLVTLLLNFVGVLLVGEALQGEMGEPGAGFPQSPLFPREALLPPLVPGTDLHLGILIALAAALGAHLLLWRTTFGFRLRLVGSSRAAAYAGVSLHGTVLGVMLIAGALAGLAGAIEVVGIHYRLIEGFSQGFGFTAVGIALLGALNPLAVVPAAFFFGFLETGMLAMQRQVGVPSSLVLVIEGLTMLFVLAAMGLGSAKARA